MNRTMRVFIVTLIVLASLATLLAAVGSSGTRLVRAAARALAADDFRRARQLAEHALREPGSADTASSLACLASVKLRDDDAVLAWRPPDDRALCADDVDALLAVAQVRLRRGEPHAAEETLRRAIELDPARLDAHEQLAQVLEWEGRTFEALAPLAALVRGGRFAGEHLLLLGSIETQFLDPAAFNRLWREADPNDPRRFLFDARAALLRNESEQARRWLSEIVAAAPDHVEAQAWLGRVLAETRRWVDFLAWRAALPPQADAHPETWFARAVWARQAGQARAAARCYWEALRRHPQHTAANYQLAQVFVALGERDLAAPFAERAGHSARLEDLLRDVRENRKLVPQIVSEEEQLGRYWEAAAWCHLALREDESQDWPRPVLRRLQGILARDAALQSRSSDATRQIDLSDWPLPDWTATEPDTVDPVSPESRSTAIAFTDRAAALGIQFHYCNGADPATGIVRMHEFIGGGAAVLDYDCDLWPDLYLPQGCRWPPDGAQREHVDCLYRNLSGEKFREVGHLAGLQDNGYSQGAALGDVDGDGFADLYLGNIGANRLYLNQGDGTFRDATEASGTAGHDWTTSGALADFDGDGLADLYVVNYLEGDVFERRCQDNGKPAPCAPSMFPAAEDRIYLNRGDGSFDEVARRSGAAGPDGKGLGLAVADFDRSHRLSIFVSNDTTANFFFANHTPARGGPLSFAETAIVSGLAFDAQGRAQASMGIAVDDADGDGRPDLFVTNFFHESNAFYRQQPDGSFQDESRAAGLRDASFAMLGWGAQFIDADLDGLADLLLLNGHINDLSSRGTPFRMPPQFFRNTGSCQFEQAPAETLGSYFEGRYLGRALARLDWNRDGLEDACATHIDAPAALLTNQTSRHGHYLAVRLVGVASARDPIGATVQLHCGRNLYTKQLTAGDGFEASNQRQIVFGLGDAEQIDELIVSWPAGGDQVFRALQTDREILLIEGRSELVQLILPR